MEYASGCGRRAPLKLYHIVRLQHMVKQWRRAAQLSKKRLHHVLARSLSTSSFDYTLISTNTNTNNNNMAVPKKGHIAVYVGDERRRFVVPVRSLNHPAFHNLLVMAEEEFQFHYHGGGLTIPCDVTFFEQFVLPLLLEQGCQYNSTRASTSSFTINREQGGYKGVASEVPTQLPPPPNNHYCSNILDSTYIHIPSPLGTRA